MRGCRGPELATRAFHRDLQNSFDNHWTHLVLRLASAALGVRNFVLNTYLAARSPHYFLPALQARPLVRWHIPIVWDGSPNA